eukprot:GHUV01021400.1.p1 GENE.GHUV01021400.1~~GHUV01021400.1.p1  ORF type:complete len:225 (-),score=68.07 GHUV01021400.1:22-696(-)
MDQVHIARQRAQESREAALQAEQHLLSVTAALANHAASGPPQFVHREPSSLGGVSVVQAPTMQPPGLQHPSLPTATKIDTGITNSSTSLLSPVSEAMQGLLVARPIGQSLTSTPTSVLSALSASEPLTFYGSPDMSLNSLTAGPAIPGLLGSANLQDMTSGACGTLPITTAQQQQQPAPVCIVLPQQTQPAQQPIVLYQAVGGELVPGGCNYGNAGTNSLFYHV